MNKITDNSFEGLDDDALRELAYKLSGLTDGPNPTDKRPETDDELHKWIIEATGINITRTAASPDTNAPFEWFSDMFFGRVSSALVIGSRGSGKSFLAALLLFALCYWYEDIECLSVGAIEIQAKRVYAHVLSFLNKAEEKLGDNKVNKSQMSSTLFTNGASYEVLTSSPSAVNGPHAQVVHRDEVELMKREVYTESLNIEKSKKNSKGMTLKTRTLLTSTRKTSVGLMQKLIDECNKAEQEGRIPPFKIYNMNCYDVIENMAPNHEGIYCRSAFPDKPEEELCNCDQVVSGEWEEGVIRTFEDCCNGVLANAQGFTPLEDYHNIFMKSPQPLWEAQQENKRPYVDDISYPQFSKKRHGIRGFEFDPANGPVFVGLDVGGTNPHAVEWAQLLEFEVEVKDFNNLTKKIPEGSLVVFREVYEAEIGINDVAKRIIEVEMDLKAEWHNFRVEGRFMDPQAKSQKIDLKRHNPPLDFSKWPTMTRDREVHFERLRDRINDDKIFFDLDECPMICEELEVYNILVKEFDHAHDAVAYLNSNVYALLKKGRQGTGVPNVKKRGSINTPDQFSDKIPSVVKVYRGNQPGSRPGPSIDNWRDRLFVGSTEQNRFSR